MKILAVLSLVAVAAWGDANVLHYPSVYGGIRGMSLGPNFGGHISSYGLPLKTIAPHSIPLNTIAPSLVAPAPISLQAKYSTPLTYNMAPVAPLQSQYHSQDEMGQYNFGYAGGPSSRAESRDVFGVVRGSYNYVDSEGQVQTQHYVADALGFRAAGTNLPVAPDAPESSASLSLPEPVKDTPEVAAAKADFKIAFDEAKASRSDSRKKRSVSAVHGFYSPLRYSYGFSTPLQYSRPAILPQHVPYTAAVPAWTTYAAAGNPAVVRNSELLEVTHNPGHATSYRVD